MGFLGSSCFLLGLASCLVASCLVASPWLEWFCCFVCGCLQAGNQSKTRGRKKKRRKKRKEKAKRSKGFFTERKEGRNEAQHKTKQNKKGRQEKDDDCFLIDLLVGELIDLQDGNGSAARSLTNSLPRLVGGLLLMTSCDVCV